MTSVKWQEWPATLFIAIAVTLTATACGDEIVYRDRPNFENPPAGAADFLGYSNADEKKTTCGNCHVSRQAVWQQTDHAHAWETLKASGQSKAECEACHSVSSLGNVTTTQNVGYVGTHNVRYEDVQCESCHGPGLTHVMSPDRNNRPLASMAVGPTLTRGCGECHSGQHQPFAEQWAASRHAKAPGSRADPTRECSACHEAKGVFKAWGINTAFLEQTTSDTLAITCPVCHDPHDARNPGQLRFPIDEPNVETNLCMKCHHRRANPEVASSSGPHSPQGPVLLGEAGWFPPNFQYPPGSLVGSHGSDRNPRLCATCHVSNYTVNDKLTGAFTFRATGHRFQPIPCVDAQGIPTNATDCLDTERSYKACVVCHLSETAARSALSVARTRIARLADEIDSLRLRIPASEFSTTDNRISTGEGARFNSQLARERGSAAHNPFLIEALLLASLNQIKIDYGLSASARLSMKPELAPR